MLALFICTTVTLAIVLVVMLLKLDRYKELSDFWSEKWYQETKDHCETLDISERSEQGVREIEENYQQELLDEYDKVAALDSANQHLHRIVDSLEQMRLNHEVYCLPRLNEDWYPAAEDDEEPVYEQLALEFYHYGEPVTLF